MPEWNPPATDDDIITLETVTANYLNGLGNSLRYLERIAFVKRTTPYTTTATSSATATEIIALPSTDFDGLPLHVRFYAPSASHSTTGVNFRIELFDGTTALALVTEVNGTARQAVGSCDIYLDDAHLAKLADGAHTLSVRGWVGSGTGTLDAGAGGAADTFAPAYLEVWRPPIPA